jgi:hypothetical protein
MPLYKKNQRREEEGSLPFVFFFWFLQPQSRILALKERVLLSKGGTKMLVKKKL